MKRFVMALVLGVLMVTAISTVAAASQLPIVVESYSRPVAHPITYRSTGRAVRPLSQLPVVVE